MHNFVYGLLLNIPPIHHTIHVIDESTRDIAEVVED